MHNNKSSRGRSAIARRVRFGGPSANGTMPTVEVMTYQGQKIKTNYFGGPIKGGSAPSATGFMRPSSMLNQISANAGRSNYVFEVSSLAKSNPITTQPLILYYKLRTADGTTPFVDTLNFEVSDTSTEYRGITITSLANEAFVPIENTSVVFIGYRVPNTNTGNFVRKIYVEEFTITDADDHEFRAAKVYPDEADGFETTVPSVKYNVVYASGKYTGRTAATIFFDNDGTGFGKGQTFARQIELE